MVKIINNDGVTCVESYLHVDQEFAEVLKNKANKKLIEDMCKDLHAKHRLEEQNNEFTSVLGTQINGEVPASIVINLGTNHQKFIEAVIHFNEKRTDDVDDAGIDELPAVIQKLIGKCAAIIVAIPKSE